MEVVFDKCRKWKYKVIVSKKGPCAWIHKVGVSNNVIIKCKNQVAVSNKEIELKQLLLLWRMSALHINTIFE